MLAVQLLSAISLLLLSAPTASGRPAADVDESWKRTLLSPETANANRLEKRQACTTTAQCTGAVILNAYRQCISNVCTSGCNPGFYFDVAAQQCKPFYPCVVSQCTNALPAFATRICASNNLCSFQCQSGYTLNAAKTGCMPVALIAPITTTRTTTSLSPAASTSFCASKCTQTIPANSRRSCTAAGVCSFACVAGYVLGPAGRGCALISTATTTTTRPPTTPLSSLRTTTATSLRTTTATMARTTTTTAQAVSTGRLVPLASFAQSTRLADGLGMRYGDIHSSLRWQSSGVLSAGTCGNTVVGLGSCWRLYLDSTGMLQDPPAAVTTAATSGTTPSSGGALALSNLDNIPASFRVVGLSLQEQSARDDENLELYYRAFPESVGGLQKRATCSTATTALPTSTRTASTTSLPPVVTPYVPASPRQRIEFLSWPGAAAGSSWMYTWTTYQSPGHKTSERFFHTWQLFSRDPCVSGPIFTLSSYLDTVRITDALKRCSPTTTPCPSIPITSYWGRTIVHTLAVTYGANGRMTYTAVDRLNPSVALLRHSAVGQMGSVSSLKFGMYRAAGTWISEAEAFVGAYRATKIA